MVVIIHPGLSVHFDELNVIGWRNDDKNVLKVGDVSTTIKLQTWTYGGNKLQEEQVLREVTSKRFLAEVSSVFGMIIAKRIASLSDVVISLLAELNHNSDVISMSLEVDSNLLNDMERFKPIKIAMGGILVISIPGEINANGEVISHDIPMETKGLNESSSLGTLYTKFIDHEKDLQKKLFNALTTAYSTVQFKNLKGMIIWEYCLRQCSYNITTLQFDDESFKDLTIVVKDGVEFSCHKNVFTVQSPVFEAMISRNVGMLESVNARVELLDIGKEAFGVLLPYFYGNGISVFKLDPPQLVELLMFALQYQLQELELQLKVVAERRSRKLFRHEDALKLYYFSKKVDGYDLVKNQALNHIIKMCADVEDCGIFKGLEKDEQSRLKSEIDEYKNKIMEKKKNI